MKVTEKECERDGTIRSKLKVEGERSFLARSLFLSFPLPSQASEKERTRREIGGEIKCRWRSRALRYPTAERGYSSPFSSPFPCNIYHLFFSPPRCFSLLSLFALVLSESSNEVSSLDSILIRLLGILPPFIFSPLDFLRQWSPFLSHSLFLFVALALFFSPSHAAYIYIEFYPSNIALPSQPFSLHPVFHCYSISIYA